MKEREGAGKSPNQELKNQSNNHLKEQGGTHKENATNDSLFSLVEKKLLNQLSFTPSGEDPAFGPIIVLNQIDFLIVTREYTKNKLRAATGEIVSPMQEALRKVKTAYEIIAYPYCKQEGRRDCIESELESDRQAYGRDQVELNDTELGMLSKFAAVRRIPLDPQKRIYNYSEVPLSPNTDPYGRRHMTTDEIRKRLNE